MKSTEGIIPKQLLNELNKRGIRVGNKVKLRDGSIKTIKTIRDNEYPIVLSSGLGYIINGLYMMGRTSDYDIVDLNYKELEDLKSRKDDKEAIKRIKVGE